MAAVILRPATRASIACLGLLLAVFVPCSATQEPAPTPDSQRSRRLTQMSLEDLAKIEVTTASKRPEEIWRTPAAIHVITQEDIRRSGATSLPEVLRLAPGVVVARIDSNHWAVGVRGFGDQFSKSVLVLIDGRSVYTPLFAGVFWSVQDTLLEDIERIEIIRGPGGTIWGANAVNGVINIITKKAGDTGGFLVTAGGGSVDQGIGGMRYGGGNGRGFDYRFYAKGFTRGPQFHFDNSPFDDWRRAQAGFRTDWRRGSRDTFTFRGDIYKGEDGQRVSIATFSPPSQGNVDQPVDVSGGNLMVQWRRELSADADLQIQGYYDRTYLFGPQLGETRDTFDVDFTHGFAAGGRQDFVGGLGARLSPSTFEQTILTLDFIPRKRTNAIYSWFVQDEFAIVPNRLWVTAGSKFEHNNYTGFEWQPGARILWEVAPGKAVWGAFTRAIRTPSRLEEEFQLTGFLLVSPLVFIQIDGNRDLDAERMFGYEAGYRAALTSSLHFDLAFFHNQYDNLIGFGAAFFTVDNTPPPPHITLHIPWDNAIKGSTSGVEVAPDWKPTEWLGLRGSYSYLNLDVRPKAGNTDTGTVAQMEGSSPHHQVAVQALMNLPAGLELDLSYRFVSELPARMVEGYATADVRLGWRVRPELEFSIAGQNLFQPHQIQFAHDPGPSVGIRRSVFAKVTWSSGR
ncbi:MAG: TonB-dependent receptor plug domain-containing protein [Candidatus Acidiferrales bacterium]